MSSPEKIALVTGANRGLGKETARQLAQAGYHVVLTSRSAAGQAVADEYRAAGLSVDFHPLDVADGQSIGELTDYLTANYPHLDVLINNAGIHYDTFQNTLNADFAIVEEAIHVNTIGPWRLSKALIPLLQKSAGGRIVNVSSSSGSFADSWPGTPAYSISKAALNMLTLKLAADLADTPILVNSVCPGWVRTEMGGEAAPRSVAEGAASIIWAALLPEGGPTGGFFRDGERVSW
ncbi:SDR family oxidoreductase [Neolewinella lacunae]|uniref:SDR family oxidoreductase n=1 Tax=Neolewinella lacunae TaxID=1517758 RepID=A0A923PJL3_9BACT|nr:SDR family oxidoreductase [Neolewinella lacunae]MBC6994529.1 SDR family oxidoreductase [Neolewinella lacunae]MDN3634222.1 SDR family oxidoreductase [Neolewinella lacunae]